MQVQNPSYQYYKKLAGTWKNTEGTCVLTLTTTVGLTASFGGAVLDGHYDVYPVDPSNWPGMQNTGSGMPMMGMMGMMGQTMTFHSGEDMALEIGDKSLKNGDQVIYTIESGWHDLEDKMHLELLEVATGNKYEFTLFREGAGAAPVLKEGEVLCECGQIFSSKFCPNCGKPRNP